MKRRIGNKNLFTINQYNNTHTRQSVDPKILKTMNIMNKLSLSFLLAFIFLTPSAQQYQNFEVSVYCRAYEVKQMADTNNYLKPKWDEISRQLKVDKVYLERIVIWSS